MKKSMILVVLAVLLCVICSFSAAAMPDAHVPYTTYDYNAASESIPAPPSYVPYQKITAETLGLELPFSAPTDIYYDNQDTVYILDSGNSRILVLDKEFNLKKVFDEFEDESGFPVTFEDAKGCTVDAAGNIIVADTASERVLVFDSGCVLRMEITRPEKAMQFGDLPFEAEKVLTDKNGRIYVLVKSSNMGAFVFTPDGEFERFFGSNPVVKTAEIIRNYFLRQFLTTEQLNKMVKATPISISNFDIDKDEFIFTTTINASTDIIEEGMVRKLNYLGDDTLAGDIEFGDLEWDRKQSNLSVATLFSDISVDEKGFINLLDSGRGRVFQYTEDGLLIGVMGAYGDQLGSFGIPEAVRAVGDVIYVTDSLKNCIHSFVPSEYGTTYREAVMKLKNNDFDIDDEVGQLLSYNSNNYTAYYLMGRVNSINGNHKEAMRYFKLSGNRKSYSDSFRQYRSEVLKAAFLPAVVAVVMFMAFFMLLKRRKVKSAVVPVGDSAYSKAENKGALPLYILTHPIDGFYQAKTRNIGSLRIVGGILLSFYLIFTFRYLATGYAFNYNRAADYNVFIILLQTVGVTVLFVAANWSVCTLFNGSGKLKDIAVVTTYSLLPFLAACFIVTILSNVLVMQEGAFLSMIMFAGIMWSAFLLLCGLYSIHEYTMTKTIFSVVFTVIGMAVIIFLMLLFSSLIQQTGSFFYSIVQEALLK